MKKLLSIILATILILDIFSSFSAIAVSTDDDYVITENDVTETSPVTTDIEPSSEQEQTTSEQVTTEPVTDIEPTTTEVQPTTPVKPPVVKVKKISMKSYLHLKAGKKATIKATVTPTNATNRKINWKSSNTKVAKVNQNGKVTAKRTGACTVTATAKDGSRKFAKCLVVVGKLARKIALNKTNATIYTGDKLKLKATFTPKKIAYKGIRWTTSDNKIAKVSKKGKVTALKKGSVVIKATAKDGSKKTAKCKITVKSFDYKKLSNKELRSKKVVNRICKKLNNWYEKYGATIDPTLTMKCGSWYYTSTNFYPLPNHTINEIYLNTLDLWLNDMSGDCIKNGDDWAGIKGYDYESYYKWLDNLTPKIILDGNKNGWSEYLKYCRIYCYPEEWTDPLGRKEYYIYFCNVGDVEPEE